MDFIGLPSGWNIYFCTQASNTTLNTSEKKPSIVNFLKAIFSLRRGVFMRHFKKEKTISCQNSTILHILLYKILILIEINRLNTRRKFVDVNLKYEK